MKSPLSALVFYLFCSHISMAQIQLQDPRPKVNFSDYENLVQEVKVIREKRLINLDTFLAFQQEENTVILDTRSERNYKAIHIKGAINLPFTEFTTQNLRRLIPDTNTRILIYCNNNIEGDPVYFGSKTYSPEDEKKRKKYNSKAIFIDKSHAEHSSRFISLALNIPTYINLYGYGYRNIYELNELVNIKDYRVKFEKNKKALKRNRNKYN